jgi:hypothetical protein
MLDGACGMYGGEDKYKMVIWWVKAEEERPLRIHKNRLEDNIEMNLRETVLGLYLFHIH